MAAGGGLPGGWGQSAEAEQEEHKHKIRVRCSLPPSLPPGTRRGLHDCTTQTANQPQGP